MISTEFKKQGNINKCSVLTRHKSQLKLVSPCLSKSRQKRTQSLGTINLFGRTQPRILTLRSLHYL